MIIISKLKFFFTFFTLGFILTVQTFAQNSYLDSLTSQISVTENDSLKVRLHFRYAWNAFYVVPTLALAHIDSAREIATQRSFNRERIVADHYYGLYHRDRGNFDTAIAYFNRALRSFEELGDKRGMTAPLYNLGAVYDDLGDLERSVSYYLQEMKLNEELGLHSSVANTCNGIGILYRQMGDLEKAMQFYDKGLQILEKHPFDETKSLLLGNKANIFLDRSKLDSALLYAIASQEIEKRIQRDWGLAHNHHTLAAIYQQMGRLDQANFEIGLAIKLNRALSAQKELVENYLLYCQILKDQNKLDQALSYCNDGIALSQELQLQHELYKGHKIIAEIYEMRGRPHEALGHLRFYQVMQDSMHRAEYARMVNDLNLKYETEKNEKILLEQSVTIRQQEVERQWTIAIGGFVILLLILSSILFYGRQKLEEAKTVNQENEIKYLKKDNKMFAMSAMISGQEEERKRIARELHDGLGGLLSTVKIKLQRIQREIDELRDSKVYDQAESLIANACDEVRRISHNMMPESLLRLGLTAAIEDLVEHLRGSTDLQVTCYFEGMEESLSTTLTTNIFRIVQELVANVIRHARATGLHIQITRDHLGVIRLTVEDNGVGFQFDEGEGTAGIGINNVKSRVAYLNGDINFQTATVAGGTSVEIEIPGS